MFRLKGTYTREEIHAEVGGGGLQDYLPNKEGRVLAACFGTDKNPEAPRFVLPGTGPRIQKAAEIFSCQRQPVPTFIKRGSGRWEFVGYFVVKEQRFDSETVRVHAGKAERSDVTSVLMLEKVEK